MSPPDASPRSALPVAETLLVATAGGVAFAWTGFPAGLIAGSTLVTAIAALLGRPMTVPMPLGRVCFVLIGILLGAVVTPETLRGVATWPLSIALLAICTVIMTVTATSYLRFVHDWEPLSALLGASPGSLGQAMILSAELGADIRGIAIVQTIRVLLITLGLPGGLALFGFVASAAPPSPPDSSWTELAIVAVASTATALVMHKVKFPGGLLFGSMAASAILHGGGFVHATLPWWLGAAAVVVMGGLTGARFANTTLTMLREYLWAALGSFAVSIAVSSVFVLVVTAILPFRVADVVIAFAPGAQDTMMVLALALYLDPVFVSAHHLTRFLVVTFSVALTARKWARRES